MSQDPRYPSAGTHLLLGTTFQPTRINLLSKFIIYILSGACKRALGPRTHATSRRNAESIVCRHSCSLAEILRPKFGSVWVRLQARFYNMSFRPHLSPYRSLHAKPPPPGPLATKSTEPLPRPSDPPPSTPRDDALALAAFAKTSACRSRAEPGFKINLASSLSDTCRERPVSSDVVNGLWHSMSFSREVDEHGTFS